jgi:uncharacterized protein (DUF2164 family)
MFREIIESKIDKYLNIEFCIIEKKLNEEKIVSFLSFKFGKVFLFQKLESLEIEFYTLKEFNNDVIFMKPKFETKIHLIDLNDESNVNLIKNFTENVVINKFLEIENMVYKILEYFNISDKKFLIDKITERFLNKEEEEEN